MSYPTVETRWNGSDYILRGQFCPPEAIASALDWLRREVGADMALLLVAGPRGLLQSLCLAVSEDARGEELTDLLRREPGLRPRRFLRPFTGQDDDAFPGSATQLLRRVRATVETHGGDVELLIGSAAEWIALDTPEELAGTPLAVAAFLRTTQSGDATLPTIGGVKIVQHDRHVSNLAVMVNATAQAQVHHDAIVLDRVDQALDASVLVGKQIDLALAAEKLVELAREVTSSDVAGYYAADFEARTLHLRASSGDDALLVLPPTLDLDGDRVAAISAERTRPVLLDPGNTGRLASTTESAEGAAPVAEMATPVPGPLAGGPILGVITVARGGAAGRQPNPFGAYDHALARNVALRLALLRATADLESAAEMFTRLLSPTAALTSSVDPPRSGPPIPDDLLLALADITRGLRTIRTLTNSHSATFRAALPSVEATAPHDLALYRIAADPPERLNDARPVQQVDGDGINCRAAVLGTAHNVPFVAQDAAFESLREGTSSEMSVPVFVEGLVVGVVNLESTSEQNYDTRRATVIAFAEHVGVLIAIARLTLSRRLDGYAVRIISRAHELSHNCEAITSAMDKQPPTTALRATIEQNLDEIEARARGLRDFDDTDTDVDGSERSVVPATMPQLVTHAIDVADLVLVRTHLDDVAWSVYDADAATHIRESLHHIFTNVFGQRPVTSEPVVVTVSQAQWGGRTHDVVQVTNPTRDRLDADRACNFYRVPVYGSGGPGMDGSPVNVPRFGAYLAGGHARALGGEVHLLPLDERHARVALMVPAPAEGADGNAR